MLVTYNNTGRLPGFENKSKGIIVVTYVFNEGHQTDDCQNLGKPYPGLTKTAFLPLSPMGSEVLDLLQRAFDARVTFRFASTPTHPNGELVWNDILHKENIFGGPKVGGFPDHVYLDRIRKDLLTKGFH
jgi:deltex